jgi:hypothetical protein
LEYKQRKLLFNKLKGGEILKKLNYDKVNKRYFIEDEKGITYLFRKDCIGFILDKNEIYGTIEYSEMIEKNYYIQLDNNNYIPLFKITEIL